MACGPDRELLRLIIQDLINQLINDGVIQAGLRDCGGNRLLAHTQVLGCDFNPTDTKVTGLFWLDGNVMRLQLSDGTVFDLQVPRIISGEIAERKLVLTENTGEKVEIDLCNWRGAQPCEYYPTLQVPIGGQCPFARAAYIYHPEDLRDPAATVRLVDCDGTLQGWLYETKLYPHLLELEVEGQLVGYASPAPMVRVWNTDCCHSNTP